MLKKLTENKLVKLGALDIGSNTVLLLLAEFHPGTKTLKTVLNRYEIPRLSENLSWQGYISEKSIKRFFNVLENYFKIIHDFNPQIILAKATNAFRIASNSDKIIAEVKKKFGVEIEIISGSEEARLTYLGASSSFGFSKNLIIDIGGGSTEIIMGEKNQIFFAKSYPVGVVSLTEKFITKFPAPKKALREMEAEIIKALSDVPPPRIEKFNAIAVAGTPTTIVAISKRLERYEENKIEGSKISEESLSDFLESLKFTPPEEILREHPFIRGREDLLLAGTLILLTLLKYFQINEIHVSGKGLRYGILIDFLLKQYNLNEITVD